MARLFNVEVFNMTIGNGGAYYTGQEFYNLLGSADHLLAQVEVDAVTATTTNIEVTFETTNAPEAQTWIETDYKLDFTISSITAVPHNEALGVPGDDSHSLGAFGRYRITSDQPATTIRITVCGRSV